MYICAHGEEPSPRGYEEGEARHQNTTGGEREKKKKKKKRLTIWPYKQKSRPCESIPPTSIHPSSVYHETYPCNILPLCSKRRKGDRPKEGAGRVDKNEKKRKKKKKPASQPASQHSAALSRAPAFRKSCD
jgi:hypothetical protein